MLNKDQLFDQIDNNELDAVFEILEKNKAIFKGFQDLRDRFIYDNPKGVELQRFKQALKAFIGSKMESEAEVTPEPQDINLMKVIEIRQLIEQGLLEKTFREMASLMPERWDEVRQLKLRASHSLSQYFNGVISVLKYEAERSEIVNEALALLDGRNTAPLTLSSNNETSETPPETRDIGDGKNEKPLIYDNKDVMEVPMATDAREFIPFKDVKEPIKILFLAAGQLNTGKESRFKDLIYQFDKKERFLVNEEHGLSPEQFQNHLIFENPYIVHYGGHGFREGIVLEGANLAADVLTEILKLSENTQCVILNACNTLPIARSIAQHIPYAIGTQAPIDDKAAIAFARGFYMGIVAGKTIEAAFKSGILAIRAANLPDAGVPVLVRMEGYKTKATIGGV